ncbi:MAG: hypothetical protein IJH90_09250 [Mogibacterium sp.]|nr:hypothetical protein [Mogibacterium sp.]
MTELLEKDKDRLLTELADAKTAEKAIRMLENETDKLLIRYNEQCSGERERDAAAHLMQAVRLALPLIDSTGRTKIWERGADGKETEVKSKVAILPIILMILGIALIAFGVVPLILYLMANTSGDELRTELLTRGSSALSGAIVLFASGVLYGKPKEKSSREQHVEISVDPAKVYRAYRAAILSVDQSLDEVSAMERWNSREQAGNIDGRPATTPEIELFSDLLAASYSGDPEYALEKIDDIKYYLHRQQIEAVDYSEETKQYFDLMPGVQGGTIRPALIADGALLKKGLASKGK